MHLVNKTRYYSFDEEAYTRFLIEYGFTSEEIGNLTVILGDLPPARLRRQEAGKSCIIYGYYLNWEIHLFTHSSRPEKMNAILAHETSHYWDAVQAERDLDAAATSLDPEAYRRYVLRWRKWRWSDAFFDAGEIRARAEEETSAIEVITRPIGLPVLFWT